MTDPFAALHVPLTPVQPDPAFAARLRERVRRALGVPTMTIKEREEVTTHLGVGAAGLVPNLIVADGRRALDWYIDVLGAQPRGEPIVMPDGRIGHAELEVSGALLYVSDEFPELQLRAPAPGGDISVSLQAYVPDVDALTERAVRVGAVLERPPSDQPYGRSAVIRDPFGHRWMLTMTNATIAPVEVTDRLREGDIGYVSLWVTDVQRASDFYADVLGWEFEQPVVGPARQVRNTVISHGLAEMAALPPLFATAHSTLFLCFVVEDVDAAVARVRAAGGQAEQPVTQPYGRIANCVDDQGLPFALNTPAFERPLRAVATGQAHGDIAYVVLEAPDAARAREFYSRVLGWHFAPGRSADGWNVMDVAPMSGLWGGHARPTVVPMYRVDDIEAAVARVRADGGTSSDPHREPYGIAAECTDDQGTRFLLGQF